MWPLPVVRRVGQSYRKIECCGYIRCSKNSLMTINGKVQRSRIAVPSESHTLVEFDCHTWIEELAWSHKGIEGVVLHKSHGVPKLKEGGEGQNVIKVLIA